MEHGKPGAEATALRLMGHSEHGTPIDNSLLQHGNIQHGLGLRPGEGADGLVMGYPVIFPKNEENIHPCESVKY